MTARRVAVVGAGVGGLTAAIELALQGRQVDVFERASEPGGKMHQLSVAGVGVDAGPTVFTMRWVFDPLFEACGTSLEAELAPRRADILARHAWTGGGELDLHADVDASAEAIAVFAGEAEAEGYRALCRDSAQTFQVLRDSFIAGQRPSPLQLLSRVGVGSLGPLLRSGPFGTMWSALGRYFDDPRLRQLFARYSTYVGSSPLQTPATLLLIAHVEQDGVWLLPGGMRSLGLALQRLGESLGVRYHFGAGVRRLLLERSAIHGVELEGGERMEVDAAVFNGDVSALSSGLLGGDAVPAVKPVSPDKRGLSAFTWCVRGRPRGMPLHYHNVFFSGHYPREFQAIFNERRVTGEPTVYLCAQDRLDGGPGEGDERLLMLVNAPAEGDQREYPQAEIEAVMARGLAVMRACGVELDYAPERCVATTPADFERRFPASGGSLYGRASHGPWSSFVRPGARSRVKGLFLAGGSVHPGPGVPMAAMSGRLAADAAGQWLDDAGSGRG